MHGYQIITTIRKEFGVYFGLSTVYPILGMMEKKGYLKSAWNMDFERPRKVYTLTIAGKNILNFSENSLNFIRKNFSSDNKQTQGIEIIAAPTLQNRVSYER
jgi:DNA-binding PadR family transcriptional regulator